MKTFSIITLAAAVVLAIAVPGTWAQAGDPDEFTLEEIMVTAEKREVNVQSIPASIEVIVGANLVTQGKVTPEQMLESVPNLKYGEEARGLGSNSGITIRGVKKTEDPGGPSGVISPSSANYVDGIYDGVGGNFDIERIEVLRGPQGTLYGRAAAGGVVSFHTKDPRLDGFNGNVFVEYGTASRINSQGAVNVPISGQVALRAAVHYVTQDEDYWAGDGVESETTEGRIKVLYQPTDKFSAIFSVTAGEEQTYSGGWTNYLPEPDPDSVIEEGLFVDIGKNIPQKSRQYAIEANYDLENSTLTYIGAIHEREEIGEGSPGFNRGSLQYNIMDSTTETQTHELRWTSDAEGRLKWLIGASYYDLSWDKMSTNMQLEVLELDLAASVDAPVFAEHMQGSIKEFGIFTEETFDFRDDMRLTLGLRYDNTDVEDRPSMRINRNIGPMGASLNPAIWVETPDISVTPTFDEITYKIRFEYDLTPENMLYALTGDGYISGMTAFSPEFIGGFPPSGVNFVVREFEQMEVTSYELGSKNRFINDTLQINAALFYLDFEGYHVMVQTNPGAPPPPLFVQVSVPVIMKGLELDATWLLTANDRMTLSTGWLDAKIDEFQDMPGASFTTRDMMYFERVPGLPEWTATFAYDHTFLFGNGSSLVPRFETIFTSSYNIEQISLEEATVTEVDDAGNTYLPYVKQDSTVHLNLGATWTSPGDMWTITGYMRNALDEKVKKTFRTSMGQGTPPTVTLGDPRTYGIMVGVRF
jgi:iron complex outermembrane receptor protein